MRTWIYKGKQRPDAYLYVNKPNSFDDVPEALLKMMGELCLVVDIELTADRKLAQAKVTDVIQQLAHQGYYLQLPPGDKKPERLC